MRQNSDYGRLTHVAALIILTLLGVKSVPAWGWIPFLVTAITGIVAYMLARQIARTGKGIYKAMAALAVIAVYGAFGVLVGIDPTAKLAPASQFLAVNVAAVLTAGLLGLVSFRPHQ